MRPLAELERFFERLFERPTARLFKTRLQPIQIQRRIERAMENERLSTGDGTMVPNRFAVHLSPMDMGAIGEIARILNPSRRISVRTRPSSRSRSWPPRSPACARFGRTAHPGS